MLEDHLISWIHVSVLLLVENHIGDSTRVVAEMGGQSLAECLSVSGCQPLSLYTPECNWVNASSVESEPCFQGREP